MGKGKSIPDPKKEAELALKKIEKCENDLIKACKNDELSRAKKCAPPRSSLIIRPMLPDA